MDFNTLGKNAHVALSHRGGGSELQEKSLNPPQFEL